MLNIICDMKKHKTKYKKFNKIVATAFICFAASALILAVSACSLLQVGQRVKKDVTLEGQDVGGFSEEDARKAIEEQAEKRDKPPVNAAVKPGTFELVRAVKGTRVDVEATLEKLLQAEKGTDVKLQVDFVDPAVTDKMVMDSMVKIGTYTTTLYDDQESRVNNIRLASEKISKCVIPPKSEFSFNGIVGRRTGAKGYEEAPIIISTEDGPKGGYGVGGGICQLSTTIYNSALSCGLDITERHLHSKKVPYVDRGDDATVAYGKADLKFRNNRKYPIMFRITLDKDSLTVDIYENRML